MIWEWTGKLAGCIFNRNDNQKGSTYRVCFRVRGKRTCYASFASYEEAKEFLDKYEPAYMEDDELFWEWLRQYKIDARAIRYKKRFYEAIDKPHF